MAKNIDKNMLIAKIKEKKELSGISNSVIGGSVDEYLKLRGIDLGRAGEKDIKIITKEIRASLRKFSGRYQKGYKNRIELLENSKINELLMSHSSSAERIDFYPELKKIIYSLDIKSILDLGCGLNPIAIAKKGVYYYAIDIKEDDLEIVGAFFKKNGIEGKTIVEDIRRMEKFPKADMCIILKVLDIVEENGHKIAKRIIEKIESKYTIIGFAKKTLSGKPMRRPRRKWLENYFENLKYKYKVFNSENEIFYFLER